MTVSRSLSEFLSERQVIACFLLSKSHLWLGESRSHFFLFSLGWTFSGDALLLPMASALLVNLRIHLQHHKSSSSDHILPKFRILAAAIRMLLEKSIKLEYTGPAYIHTHFPWSWRIFSWWQDHTSLPSNSHSSQRSDWNLQQTQFFIILLFVRWCPSFEKVRVYWQLETFWSTGFLPSSSRATSNVAVIAIVILGGPHHPSGW